MTVSLALFSDEVMPINELAGNVDNLRGFEVDTDVPDLYTAIVETPGGTVTRTTEVVNAVSSCQADSATTRLQKYPCMRWHLAKQCKYQASHSLQKFAFGAKPISGSARLTDVMLMEFGYEFPDTYRPSYGSIDSLNRHTSANQ